MSETPPPLRVVAGIWLRPPRLLAARRAADRDQGGLWELPGGKVEGGESDEEALRRELMEELGVRVDVLTRLGESTHSYPHRTIHLLGYQVRAAGTPVCHDHAEIRWVTAEDARSLAWAPADGPLVEAALRRLEGSC